MPANLYDRLADYNACYNSTTCVVRHEPGSSEAVIVTASQATVFHLDDGAWVSDDRAATPARENAERIARGLKAGAVEVRTVTRRQVYVDGLAVGDEFE